MFHNTWKSFEIQMLSILKKLSGYNHIHKFTYYLWLLSHYNGSIE